MKKRRTSSGPVAAAAQCNMSGSCRGIKAWRQMLTATYVGKWRSKCLCAPTELPDGDAGCWERRASRSIGQLPSCSPRPRVLVAYYTRVAARAHKNAHKYYTDTVAYCYTGPTLNIYIYILFRLLIYPVPIWRVWGTSLTQIYKAD